MLTQIDADTRGNRTWKVTTGPSVEPVSVDELKVFARIDGSEEDTLLASFIEAARINIENYLKRALIEQTITLHMDWVNTREIFLPRPPLISVTGIYTIDEDDVETEYSTDYYFVVTESIPGKIIIKRNSSLPSNTERDYAGYKIVYKAGYGTTPADVPAVIKKAIKQLASYYYEIRIVSDDIPPEMCKDIRSMRLRFNG